MVHHLMLFVAVGKTCPLPLPQHHRLERARHCITDSVYLGLNLAVINLGLNFAVVNRSLIGVHSIMLFFAALDQMIAIPSLWSLSFLPEYMFLLSNDVVTPLLLVYPCIYVH